MPKPFTDQEKELIRKRLVQQGHRQFSAYGLGKANVEDIARAAGISKGAFYGFYESKEALFMDVIERVEIRVRQQILAALDLPGATPRMRLLAALKEAFSMFEQMPILQFLTGADSELLFSRIPAGRWQEHLAADRSFIREFVQRCRQVGIPIRVQPEQLMDLLYPLVLAVLHRQDLKPEAFRSNLDLPLELVAAFCVGEIKIQPPRSSRSRPARKKGAPHELAY